MNIPCRSALLLAATIVAASPVSSQAPAPSAITPENLRVHLFIIADDSMGGRDPGSKGNYLTAEYVAAQWKKAGLVPAGDKGTWFQQVPFARERLDERGTLTAGSIVLKAGTDFVPASWIPSLSRNFAATPTIYGGDARDSTRWITAAEAKGKVVVLGVGSGADRAYVRTFGVISHPRWSEATAVVIAELDLLDIEVRRDQVRGVLILDTAQQATFPPLFIASPDAADRLFGAALGTLTPGRAGKPLSASGSVRRDPTAFPARNVVGILPGSDPKLRGEYIALTAHNDHVGVQRVTVEHDSLRAHNAIVRPMGADSPERAETPDETVRVQHILDSLRALRPARPDSIRNGADDDGTGTVSLIVLAEALSRPGVRPRRSVLFVSHTGEEYGLVGSKWFTDHPTVPLDSIVAEIDQDMIGRGSAIDVSGGGPTYLEVIGAMRLSREFGAQLEAANAAQALPFVFNYTFDQPGHPLQYYCRADHYSYARYGIPAVALSRGEHLDYHQVTDEPQYIDYVSMSRVTQLVFDAAILIGNADNRPALNGPRGDPKAPCRQ
jgi:hypothetical protein